MDGSSDGGVSNQAPLRYRCGTQRVAGRAYGTTPTDTAQFAATPAFVQSINADPKVDLVLHVGDIHSGKQYCTQPYDQSVYDLWTAFKDPLVYTPGDNEWTDCNKAAEGGGAYNSVTHQIDYVGGPFNGYDVPNFHRVVVHGSTFPLEWLRLTVDPRASNAAGPKAIGPFSCERVQP